MAGCCLYGALLMGMFLRKYEVFRSLCLSDSVLENEDETLGKRQARRDLPGLDRFANLPVTGMTCASCAQSVESSLMGLEGVKRANVDALNGSAQVVYDCTRVRQAHLLKAVEDAGFSTTSSDTNPSAQTSLSRRLLRWNYGEAFTWSLLCLIPILLLQASPDKFLAKDQRHVYILLLSALVQFGFGLPFHRRTWLALANRHSMPMDVLVSIATTASYCASVFLFLFRDELTSYATMASSLICVLSLGRHLESKARASVSDTLKAFTESVPLEARLVSGTGSSMYLPTDMLKEGDRISVEPGERFPCDGQLCCPPTGLYARVIEVDESFHTGEARYVLRRNGEMCLAGTLNSGQLPACVEIRSSREATGRLDQILSTLLQSHQYKSSLQTTVERAMAYMVPSVMAIAAMSFSMWLAVGTLDQALRALVATLVVACPCALGLSTPAALMAAIASSSKYGVILKRGAQAVEALSHTCTIVFDKTGTLTVGKMILKRFHIAEGLPLALKAERRWWQLVDAAELGSSHWASSAIRNHAESIGGSRKGAEKFFALHRESLVVTPGRGISCIVDGVSVVVGNQEHLATHHIQGKELQDHAESLSASESCVLVAFNGQFAGMLALEDSVAEHARDTVDTLKARGMRVLMMTGDRQSVAARVAEDVGIEQYYADMTPQVKADEIRALKDAGQTVAMVGDGINDAMALGIADVGMALHCGAPLAVASADLVLLGSSLAQLPPILDMARAVHDTIRANIRWTVVYNVMALPLAAGVFRPLGYVLHPTLAGAMMIWSSLFVTYNSTRLEKKLTAIFSRQS